jgi:hypothetical protein
LNPKIEATIRGEKYGKNTFEKFVSYCLSVISAKKHLQIQCVIIIADFDRFIVIGFCLVEPERILVYIKKKKCVAYPQEDFL